MAKFVRGKKRRFRKKSRRFRKSIRKGTKKTKYNGIYYVKLQDQFTAQCDSTVAGVGNASFNVHWAINGVNSVNDRYFSNTSQFSNMVGQFMQYRVKGVKVRVRPINHVTSLAGTNALSGVYDIASASFINAGVAPTTTTDSRM